MCYYLNVQFQDQRLKPLIANHSQRSVHTKKKKKSHVKGDDTYIFTNFFDIFSWLIRSEIDVQFQLSAGSDRISLWHGKCTVEDQQKESFYSYVTKRNT